eukprot:gnl/TRDRNA2_/TRDRNA2_162798_c1_seq2.p1 gnl/TRDRNA2_/TRDRNA2_162798_c1~~gnl/TRDRNA2_/TRDRNA2_162798_c1_seq2.p1  ORF type:complete len:148 (-),score=20.54 gnl/TRDRNA2_/TRDRNA2_162798_c1_seq2:30-473(-)
MRAELWAAIIAVERAIGPVMLLIDNAEICTGVAALARDPEGYVVSSDSDLADLWRVLRGLLRSRPQGFCTTVWVPGHMLMTEGVKGRKKEKRLAKARKQPGWSDMWPAYNARADAVAGQWRGLPKWKLQQLRRGNVSTDPAVAHTGE